VGQRLNFALALRLAAAAVLPLGGSVTAAAQTVTEYPIPMDISHAAPGDITAGSDGALWFTETPVFTTQGPGAPGGIGRITTSGTITQYTLPSVSRPLGIAAGPDGALWFTEYYANQIGRITTGGAITEYRIPMSFMTFPNAPPNFFSPNSIGAGPDGALWFTFSSFASGSDSVGRITTAGVFTQYLLSAGRGPQGITAGPDGALWFAANPIGRITTSGNLTEYPIPTASAGLMYIAVGADGALWFTEKNADKVGRITTSGAVTEFGIPTTSSAPAGITSGPDGALWFTEGSGNKIGRITTSGTITEYPIPTASSSPRGITAGPDGALWFVEENSNKVGRITTPVSAAPLVAAVLPSSRSVEVANTASAFAMIINSSTSAVNGCAIVPVTTVPAGFLYQTTNPTTNALTGSPNTPASIAASGSQSFVIALTPNAPVVPTPVTLGFDCVGVDAAPSYTGVNTLLYSASSAPVPDVVAVAATAQNDGILHIIGPNGSSAFAVATVNVGATSAITATANTGAASLPVAISLCQTDPQSGQCISSIGPSVTFLINANATPTLAVFATGSDQIPFIPQTNRIFVEFSDARGASRGSASVAVETQ
jgi:virginiamycin B lyase